MSSTIWLMGLPASGKTTIAQKISNWCYEKIAVLDGDLFRASALGQGLGYDEAGRLENIKRAASVARLMNDNGLPVVAAFVTPYEAARVMAQQIIGPDRFLLVHVATPLATCETRDPKGLYEGARQGTVLNLTGVDGPFETTQLPCLIVDGTDTNLATNQIIGALGLGRKL
jgi:adenylylsulfate kinase